MRNKPKTGSTAATVKGNTAKTGAGVRLNAVLNKLGLVKVSKVPGLIDVFGCAPLGNESIASHRWRLFLECQYDPRTA